MSLSYIRNQILGNNYVCEDGIYKKKEYNKNSSYVKNFGIQWNKFQVTQFDSFTNNNFTKNRLLDSCELEEINFKDSLVLELGSGAGRFTEILIDMGAKLVTVEPSEAIVANKKNNYSENTIFLNESLFDLPFEKGLFDYVICYGVAQHTPNPEECYRICVENAKTNVGKVSVDHYQKKILPNPFYHPKYIWRPITRRINPEKLLKFIGFYIPHYIKFDLLLIKYLPTKISTILRGLIPIPCWNYYGNEHFPNDRKSLVEWAIMDTFDALGATYDFPFSRKDLNRLANSLELNDIIIKKGGNGLVLNGTRK